MIRSGQTVENPLTGERLLFHETSRDTGGEYVRFEAFIQPGGCLPAAHVHPYQTETFEMVSGSLTIQLGGRTVEAAAGDVVAIEPGVRHNFRNEGSETARFNVEVRPALEIESLIETMYGLAADGKTNRFGMPNPFRLAVIARAHFDTVRLPLVPAWAQRTALAVGGRLGAVLGYEPRYVPATAGIDSAQLDLALPA
jgi:quercetin dioxygenase-like cupin family protein